jgi:hypothetical protein
MTALVVRADVGGRRRWLAVLAVLLLDVLFSIFIRGSPLPRDGRGVATATTWLALGFFGIPFFVEVGSSRLSLRVGTPLRLMRPSLLVLTSLPTQTVLPLVLWIMCDLHAAGRGPGEYRSSLLPLLVPLAPV